MPWFIKLAIRGNYHGNIAFRLNQSKSSIASVLIVVAIEVKFYETGPSEILHALNPFLKGGK